jgi:phosphatidylglycerol:prolipoprotein diacylglycerol transferase
MYPRLLVTSFLTIHTFGLLLAASYAAALAWLVRGARRSGVDAEEMMSVGFWAIGGALVGAKALMILRMFADGSADFSDVLSPSMLTAAGDFYGGFIGGVAGAAIAFKLHPKLSVWHAADLCAPSIALGQAIGRIGCFMAGDDYGSPTTMPWGVVFTDPYAYRIGGVPLNVPLHPVQLYESAVCLLIFLALVWLANRKRFDGEVILTYVTTYAVARFVLEYYRGDADRGFVFGQLFSTSQFIAVLLFALALLLLPFRLRSGSRSAEAS